MSLCHLIVKLTFPGNVISESVADEPRMLIYREKGHGTELQDPKRSSWSILARFVCQTSDTLCTRARQYPQLLCTAAVTVCNLPDKIIKYTQLVRTVRAGPSGRDRTFSWTLMDE